MRTTGKIFRIVMLMFMFGLLAVDCHKENMKGRMTVSMTDAPANYLQVNVEVTGLELHHEKSGWINLQTKSGIYDLLQLQNNMTVVLADNVKIPLGKIDQMRLILGANNSIVDITGTHNLTVPSGAETGLKVNIDQTVQRNNSVQVLLDFDANASIVIGGNGDYLLKPVVTVKSIIQN